MRAYTYDFLSSSMTQPRDWEKSNAVYIRVRTYLGYKSTAREIVIKMY